jgi:hypothetical protein
MFLMIALACLLLGSTKQGKPCGRFANVLSQVVNPVA